MPSPAAIPPTTISGMIHRRGSFITGLLVFIIIPIVSKQSAIHTQAKNQQMLVANISKNISIKKRNVSQLLHPQTLFKKI